MAQTVSNLTDVLKEAWTSDRLEKQFFEQEKFLNRIEKVEATMIGEKAIVPIHKHRNGGYTSVGAAGGTLNTAGQQGVDAAEYTLVYHWQSIELQTAALNQASGAALQAVVGAKDLEVKGAINDMRNQATRQLVGDGTGRIAQCTTTTAASEVELLATGYGYDAIVRGFLGVGSIVDVGTAADSDSLATATTVTAVEESSSTPSITIGSAITTDSTHYVSIANPNSATATNTELNGLRQMVSTTDALGGLDPQNAGEEFWTAAHVDSSTTTLSLNLALTLQRKVHQKTGESNGEVWTSLLQQQNFYELLQNQVRFAGDVKIGAGDVANSSWRGMSPNAIPEIYDREWYYLTLDDFCLITGAIKKPTWATDIDGSGGGLQWSSGSTAFKNAVVYPFQVGMKRRLGSAAATSLTA